MDNLTVIKAVGLTKEFLRGKKVLQDINLDIHKAELFCLIGSNGAGKTTLIKILCNLILPTSGSIFINGYNLLSEPDKARASIGLVTGDERSFYWRLTGRQNLEFFAALYNLSHRMIKKRTQELFGLLAIEEPDKVFQEYASGVKQRLSIARALLNNPEVLFMDELTKSLDPKSAEDLRLFIKNTLVKNDGKTVFFSTHQLYEVEKLAGRVAFMSKGKIVAEGPLGELKKSFGDENITIEQLYDYLITKRGL